MNKNKAAVSSKREPAEQQPSNVDQWLERETPRVRQAFESASQHFDANDSLTVNTLEAMYGQENSFGVLLGTRGAEGPAGHFQFKADTAREYSLRVSKENDQRFNIDYASSAAARYLKDIDNMFSKTATPSNSSTPFAVKDSSERYKFVLVAFNGGPGRVTRAQHRPQKAGKNPRLWTDVEKFLESEDTPKSVADQMRHYVGAVPLYETEFANKSPAAKHLKSKEPRKDRYRCTEGHWRTIDDRPVFICD